MSVPELLLFPSPAGGCGVIQALEPWQGDHKKTSQAWLVRGTLRQCLFWQRGCVSQPARHVWDVRHLFCREWRVR